MKKKRSLADELNMKKGGDDSFIPLDIDVEKIKSIVSENIGYEYSKRRNSIMKMRFKLATAAVAGVLAVSVISLNVFPSMAYALSDIPVIEDIVRAVTFRKYENKENGYEANITTPKIEGLLDKELENKLNEEFKENADVLIAAYEKDVKALKEEFGDETVHMGIESNYTIKTDNENILALDVYILNTVGSSSTKHTFYNIDKKEGKLLTLNELFKDGADYTTPISEYIKEQMEYENKNNGGMYWVESDEFTDGFAGITEDQKFYINDKDELVICFDKYEVAAGAQGSPEFVIPNEVIEDIYVGY